ncbi:MAG: DUF1203 domain-containing protein [Frankiaceae bacterium]|nr:DUF1203 domain-containing protein [Frankiaceae bacterium]MBV9870331.1 DUF1203 domain-containing protein [Frankiaceae bacterium]
MITTTRAPALPIPATTLAQLRVRDDAGRRPEVSVDEVGGSPLRCCLRRARAGERVALASYAPLRRWADATGAEPGPYEEVGPVFIHAEPCAGFDSEELPLLDGRRVFRAYDAAGRIVSGHLVELTDDHESVLAEVFAGDRRIVLVHVRAVEFGCFLYEVRCAA